MSPRAMAAQRDAPGGRAVVPHLHLRGAEDQGAQEARSGRRCAAGGGSGVLEGEGERRGAGGSRRPISPGLTFRRLRLGPAPGAGQSVAPPSPPPGLGSGLGGRTLALPRGPRTLRLPAQPGAA